MTNEAKIAARINAALVALYEAVQRERKAFEGLGAHSTRTDCDTYFRVQGDVAVARQAFEAALREWPADAVDRLVICRFAP